MPNDTIPLPPIYENHAGKWIDVDQLRARDLEVAKCVLEAAAKVCGPYSHGRWFADKIKKLEIKHE